MSTWVADIEIDVEIAHRAVSAQFSEYVALNPVKFGEGWDNLCIRYPDGMLFRFPRRETAVQLIDTEWRALPIIADQLPIAIPRPLLRGAPSEIYAYSFIGYREVAGETADRQPQTHTTEAAELLGRSLGILHRLDPTSVPLPGDHIHRKDPATILERFQKRWAAVPESEQARWGEPLVEWVRATAMNVVPTQNEAVVHGDLYPRHLVVQDGHLSGIIDWGDIHVGHPSMDLAAMVTTFEPGIWPVFLGAYGHEVSDQDLLLARLRASMYGAALLAYGLDVQDEPIAQCGRTILDRLVGCQ